MRGVDLAAARRRGRFQPVPRWQERNTLPRSLLIRLMATPKNHRSPPLASW